MLSGSPCLRLRCRNAAICLLRLLPLLWLLVGEQLALDQRSVRAASGEQLRVRALLRDAPLLRYRQGGVGRHASSG